MNEFPGCVIKLDGLASGKGVWVCETLEEAFRVIDGIFDGTLIPEGYKEYRESQ